MKSKHALAVAVVALSSCGPLTSLTKIADQQVNALEECCERRLDEGENVYGCEEAFKAHDEFLFRWEIAYATGDEIDRIDAHKSLNRFVTLAQEACH